ncbi:hypothetical protein [Terrarubrum flagellatum]|uniref:hypothetical protein n=1 Tax=Terrirubrum flagellatum TaxID=2895980 RepID=UPI003144FE77
MASQGDDKVARLPRAFVPDLTVAMRRARLEDTERSQTAADLRASEIARLEQLRVALEPIFSQTGLHAGAFDHGLVAGETPKLFIDLIAFVDCGHDRKTYRFVQDSRRGPVTLAESERVDPIVEAVTMYVARRIVEREKAIAAADIPQTIAATPRNVEPQPAPKTRFGEMLALLIVGALAGAAILYAWLKIGSL